VKRREEKRREGEIHPSESVALLTKFPLLKTPYPRPWPFLLGSAFGSVECMSIML
jgi:hypothetical protein